MAEIVITKTVGQDREGVVKITPLDSLGRPAEVDNGFELDTVEGGAEWAYETADTANLTIVMKSDLTATEFPSTTTTRGFIDADLGEGVKRIDITLVTVTIAAEAVTAGFEDLGDRPRS